MGLSEGWLKRSISLAQKEMEARPVELRLSKAQSSDGKLGDSEAAHEIPAAKAAPSPDPLAASSVDEALELIGRQVETGLPYECAALIAGAFRRLWEDRERIKSRVLADAKARIEALTHRDVMDDTAYNGPAGHAFDATKRAALDALMEGETK